MQDWMLMNYKTLLEFLSFLGFFGQETLCTSSTSDSSVMLKFTSGPGSQQAAYPGAEDGFLSVKAHNFGLHFKTSSLTTLTNFIEDSAEARESMPMHVDVSNFMLILQVCSLSDYEIKIYR